MPTTMDRKLQEYSRTAVQAARDELVVNHLWLVRHIVGKATARLPSSVDAENLESAGVLGLVEAANRFDATRGIDFKTYATPRIRGAVFDEARRNCPLPQEVMHRVSLISKAQQSLTPPVSVADLMNATGLSEDDVLSGLIAQPLIQIRSIENLESDLMRRSDQSVESKLEYDEQKMLLAEAIAALPERERVVVTLYYMEDLRQKEIGEVLHLSESRVSRLLASAQHQLREYVCIRDEGDGA